LFKIIKTANEDEVDVPDQVLFDYADEERERVFE
jgi:hypothetical protein